MTARVFLIRRISLIADTAAACVLNLYTDLPGEALALRHTANFDTANTSRRRQVDIRLPATIRGRLVQLEIIAGAVYRLFGGAMEIRALDGGDWHWVAIPGLPRELGEWREMQLPIPASRADWLEKRLAIRETPEIASWVEVPVDA